MSVVGLDGCARGWVAVVLDGARATVAHFLPNIAAVEHMVPDAEVIAIDMPIGLLDSGFRLADTAARQALGVRRSSVFATPVRAAVEAATYDEANAISKAINGVGISRQSFALCAKILEVDRWLANAPCDVREVHPEVAFAELLGRPAPSSKKTWQGMIERRDALAAAGITLEAVDPHVGRLVGTDDMLDAAAVAWTARRILHGAARSLPDPPELDPFGREIAIWV